MRWYFPVVFVLAFRRQDEVWAVKRDASCFVHAKLECSKTGGAWSDGSCNSVYGGFRGNEANLRNSMRHHIEDSFQLLVMASHFNSDEVNRLGVHKTMMKYSDDLWESGKQILKYVLKRGGRFSGGKGKISLSMPGIGSSVAEVADEVHAFATALDMMKKHAEDGIAISKHAHNKKVHTVGLGDDSFDPGVSEFIEGRIEKYTDDIRDIAGKINVLARMARNNNTRSMGLHLFDASLL